MAMEEAAAVSRDGLVSNRFPDCAYVITQIGGFVNSTASIGPDDVDGHGSDIARYYVIKGSAESLRACDFDSHLTLTQAMFTICSNLEGDMASGAQLAEIEAMTDTEAAVLAYLEASGGDVERALAFAVEDILRVEGELVTALAAVSHGYVRGSISAP